MIKAVEGLSPIIFQHFGHFRLNGYTWQYTFYGRIEYVYDLWRIFTHIHYSKNLFRAKIFKIYHKFQTNIIHYRNHVWNQINFIFRSHNTDSLWKVKGYTSVGAAVTAPVSLTFLCLLVFTLLVQPSVCSFLGNNSELFFFFSFFLVPTTVSSRLVASS